MISPPVPDDFDVEWAALTRDGHTHITGSKDGFALAFLSGDDWTNHKNKNRVRLAIWFGMERKRLGL